MNENKRSRNGRKGCRDGGGTVCVSVWEIIMKLCVVEEYCVCVCVFVGGWWLTHPNYRLEV